MAEPDHTLEFLLAFDGRIHHLEEGYWIKFEIRRVRASRNRPHGLSYSFTLHAPDGARLVGLTRPWNCSRRLSVHEAVASKRPLASLGR
jgi:hypothetical protein